MILIVDDHPDIRAMLVKLLKKDGLEAIAVASGVEALLFLKTFRPRVVLLDYSMPGMNGLAVFRQMKTDPHLALIPVIMFSAYGEELKETALAEGIKQYIQKGSVEWLNIRQEIGKLLSSPGEAAHEQTAKQRLGSL